MSAEPEVVDNASEQRYEVRAEGELAGFAQYRLRPGRIAFTHTEIDDAFAGRGLGGALARFALEDARRRELAVVPFCPFVKGYIERHPEFVELVPAAQRGSFGLA